MSELSGVDVALAAKLATKLRSGGRNLANTVDAARMLHVHRVALLMEIYYFAKENKGCRELKQLALHQFAQLTNDRKIERLTGDDVIMRRMMATYLAI